MIYFVLALVGLSLGSFVNAFVWRLHEQNEVLNSNHTDKKYLKRLSISRGRSMCSHCRHELAVKDLVPVASWLFLRGKCRYCRSHIEDSPIVELLTASLFVLSYAWWPHAISGLGLYYFGFWLVFLVAFMILAVYDLRWYILPDKLVFPLVGLAIVQLVGSIIFYQVSLHSIVTAFFGVVISSGIFYLIFLISKGEWIGGGDIKLGVIIGILIGGPMASLLMLFIASSLGSLVGIPFLLAGKRKVRIPFGPFLLLSTVIVTLFGASIIHWYKAKLLI